MDKVLNATFEDSWKYWQKLEYKCKVVREYVSRSDLFQRVQRCAVIT